MNRKIKPNQAISVPSIQFFSSIGAVRFETFSIFGFRFGSVFYRLKPNSKMAQVIFQPKMHKSQGPL